MSTFSLSPSKRGPDFGRPRDTGAHPATILAADGKTTLKRFRVDAIVYATDRQNAVEKINEDIYLEAARVLPDA